MIFGEVFYLFIESKDVVNVVKIMGMLFEMD